MLNTNFTVNWDEMNLLDMPNNQKNMRTLTVTEKGEMVINAKFIEQLKTEMPDLKINFYYSNDYRILVLKKAENGIFSLPRTGRMKYMEFAREIAKAGYHLPVKYQIEWNSNEEAWIASMQDEESLNVAELTDKSRSKKKSNKSPS